MVEVFDLLLSPSLSSSKAKTPCLPVSEIRHVRSMLELVHAPAELVHERHSPENSVHLVTPRQARPADQLASKSTQRAVRLLPCRRVTSAAVNRGEPKVVRGKMEPSRNHRARPRFAQISFTLKTCYCNRYETCTAAAYSKNHRLQYTAPFSLSRTLPTLGSFCVQE